MTEILKSFANSLPSRFPHQADWVQGLISELVKHCPLSISVEPRGLGGYDVNIQIQTFNDDRSSVIEEWVKGFCLHHNPNQELNVLDVDVSDFAEINGIRSSIGKSDVCGVSMHGALNWRLLSNSEISWLQVNRIVKAPDKTGIFQTLEEYHIKRVEKPLASD